MRYTRPVSWLAGRGAGRLPGDIPSDIWPLLTAYSRGGGCGLGPRIGSPSPHSHVQPAALCAIGHLAHLFCAVLPALVKAESGAKRLKYAKHLWAVNPYLVDRTAHYAKCAMPLVDGSHMGADTGGHSVPNPPSRPLKFSRLRLNGFKSFVDPTDLVIADGLTGVVGPNGCGKSNLLEALRWVMGENRPSAMRGGGMEDVIFAGTDRRGARNFAEVNLALDNSDRLAPPGFNETDSLDVIRRITRDAGSAYKVNGKDVRARDVQMLFADASTGAHSPALVRQGQISELINAKPQKRRRILEEAAGISGLYQRRHEAELKLNGAETNLRRLDDVLEQLAAQLATLARQAKQAARYREIGTGLRLAEGQLLFSRWKEADVARLDAKDKLRAAVTLAASSETAVRAAAKAREAAEVALPALREEDTVAAAILQRLLVERDTLSADAERAAQTIEALQGRLEGLARDGAREVTLNEDADASLQRLQAEATRLASAEDGFDDALAAATERARAAKAALSQEERALAEATEEMARLSARHQSAERQMNDAQARVARTTREAAKAAEAVVGAEAALHTAQETLRGAGTRQSAAGDLASEAEETLQAAEAARAETQERESRARAARSEAEGEANTLRAEVTSLSKLIARDSDESTPILDAITVEPGYETALGAALEGDLRASETDGQMGWARLPDYDVTQPLPAGVAPLSPHVSGPGALTRRLAQIGLVDADDALALQEKLLPGQRLVSLDGDLWRWDGYRTAAEQSPSSAALRLQQINRLQALRQDLEEVSARSEGARAAHEALTARLKDLTAADIAARDARRAADRGVAEASRAVSQAEAAVSIAQSRLETGRMAVDRFGTEVREAQEAQGAAEALIAELPPLDAARAETERARGAVEAGRTGAMTAQSERDALARDGAARRKRIEANGREQANWQKRLGSAEVRLAEIAEGRARLEAELETAQARPSEITVQKEALGAQITQAEARKAAAMDALSAGEGAAAKRAGDEREATRVAADAQAARAAAEARLEGASEAVTAARERISEDMETTPVGLLQQLEIDGENLPAVQQLEGDVARLRRQRDALGAVNLRAEEDAREVQEEQDTLITEKADLEEAIQTLRQGIASLNKEGRERLVAAFDTVNRNFGVLFTHLFGGGEARLEMVESDDPLEAGLEIMCQPPGKKLSTLSLLSGGEQTLTALALIFAVFLANPAPICVLDEVDAPLDDANVARFCDLLDEMTRRTETRFLIITHHAVTMARMDRLFGVTMGEQGVSQLVSVDLKKAEALVA